MAARVSSNRSVLQVTSAFSSGSMLIMPHLPINGLLPSSGLQQPVTGLYDIQLSYFPICPASTSCNAFCSAFKWVSGMNISNLQYVNGSMSSRLSLPVPPGSTILPGFRDDTWSAPQYANFCRQGSLVIINYGYHIKSELFNDYIELAFFDTSSAKFVNVVR